MDISLPSGTPPLHPRRILMVAACPFPERRGTPIRIERMAEELGRRGNDVHVATYHLGSSDDNANFTVHRIRNIPGYNKTDPGPSWRKLLGVDPRLLAKVSDLTRKLKPDVIHAHHFEGLLVSLPAHYRYRVPLIFDAHVLLDGELEYYDLGLPGKLRRLIARTLDKRLPRLADHVISVSDEIRDRLHAEYAFPLESVSVIANGVEPSFFEGRRLTWPADGWRRLLFAGNLARYQGVDLMLDAFQKVAAARDDTRLVIVTDSATAEFAQRAKVAGVSDRVDFVPSQLERLPDLLASADVLLNPRIICPGVPLKLLNYMASGTPIVSFAGSARYIEHEHGGLIVENGDTAAFASAIDRLLGDTSLAASLGRNARQFARCSLSWQSSAAAVEGVYNIVLDRPNLGNPAVVFRSGNS